jgi:hypothetical protein
VQTLDELRLQRDIIDHRRRQRRRETKEQANETTMDSACSPLCLNSHPSTLNSLSFPVEK